MSASEKFFLFILRLGLGWMFFYAGIVKILDPAWSSKMYLAGAKTFPGFYQALLDPAVLPLVNFINEWGLLLLGISLILGIGVRLSSVLGAVLMMLYYFPVLTFPYAGPHAYLVDDHVIYALVLLYFAAVRAGRVYGLENYCRDLPVCRKFPRLRNLLG